MNFNTYCEEFISLLSATAEDEVERMVHVIEEAYWAGRYVFIVGNGGSAANASHLCEDLGKGTLSDFDTQKRLKVMSLTDNTPYLLAWGNDTSFDRVFVEQLKNFAESGDLLLAISGSGNSPNVLRAVEYARSIGMRSFGITGYDGGQLLKLADDSLWVRSFDMGMVEAVHGVAFHHLTDELKRRFAS